MTGRQSEIRELMTQRFYAAVNESAVDLVRVDERLRSLGVALPEQHSAWSRLKTAAESPTYTPPKIRFGKAIATRRSTAVAPVAHEVHCYLAILSDDAVLSISALGAFQRLVEGLGVHRLEIVDVQRGSVLASFIGFFKSDETKRRGKQAAKEALASAESWGKAQAKKAQADVDALNAGAVAVFLNALGDAEACGAFDGFVVMKWYVGDRPKVVTKILSARESEIVDRNPGILLNPHTFIEDLARLMVESDLPRLATGSTPISPPRAIGPG